jgi:hypothetical protein
MKKKYLNPLWMGGCQTFLGAKYQNEGKYMFKMTTKIANGP